jgi:hypothetical protein
MVTIYCIEDINDLKYVGSTNKTLPCRLTKHKYGKYKMKGKCSSCELNLYNCIIYSLETCNESNRIERESYWINKIECVNRYKLNHDKQKCYRDWRNKSKEHISNYNKNYHSLHRQTVEYKKHKKDYDLFRRKSVVNGCYEFIKMLNEY